MAGGLLMRQPATICRLNRTNSLPQVQPQPMRPILLQPSMHGGCNLATTRWRHQWAVSASKGFGSSTTRERADDDTPTDKPRRRMRRQSQTLPSQQERDALSGKFQVDVQKSLADEQEAKEFAERLKALKAQGSEARGRTPAADTAATAPSAGPSAGLAAFDAPVESIYDNPPSLQATMLSSLNSDISDPKLKNAQFGPSQVGIAVSAVVFGLVFVLVAGGDFAPNNRFKGVRSAQGPPDTIQEGIINTRISDLKQQLEQTPGDVEAMQALAFSYAQLQQFDKAANLMDKVVARQPNSADAWRLLGETSLLGEQAQRSVKAYEKAVALRNNDLQIATGMVDAYIANGQQAKAVAYLEELRTRAPLVSALGVVANDAPSGTAAPAEAVTAAADGASQGAAAPAAAAAEVETAAAVDAAASSSSSGSASSSSSRVILERPPLRPLEPVAIELLLAKTYSVWRGHDNDAIATYDNVIARFQEDFRGYLAKGVFLRDKGRRADAERMFLQARYYAPENRQRFVREQSETKPVVELPDN